MLLGYVSEQCLRNLNVDLSLRHDKGLMMVTRWTYSGVWLDTCCPPLIQRISRPLPQASASNHSEAWSFTLPLSERQAGKAWEPSSKIMSLNSAMLFPSLTWDSSVGIATGYIPGKGKRFSIFPQCPDPFWSSFCGYKAAGAWSWPLTYVLCRGQEWWSYTSTPSCVITAWCLIN
jgi:hypothetical protein